MNVMTDGKIPLSKIPVGMMRLLFEVIKIIVMIEGTIILEIFNLNRIWKMTEILIPKKILEKIFKGRLVNKVILPSMRIRQV
jgi:hypothetical protein